MKLWSSEETKKEVGDLYRCGFAMKERGSRRCLRGEDIGVKNYG